MPHIILMQAQNELAGIGVAEVRCAEQHDIRLVAGDSGAGRRERGGVLPL